jgi:hypothetical protein
MAMDAVTAEEESIGPTDRSVEEFSRIAKALFNAAMEKARIEECRG